MSEVPPIEQAITPQLMREAEGGRLRWVLRHFPLDQHDQAAKLANLVLCAGDQGRLFQAHQLMFSRGSSATFGSLVADVGRLVGDSSALVSCVANDKHMNVVQEDIAFARKHGFPGTPTVLVGKGNTNSKKARLIPPPANYLTLQAALRALDG